MRVSLRMLVIYIVLASLSIPLNAYQEPPSAPTHSGFNVNGALVKVWVVDGKVRTLRGDPVKGAKVVVQPVGGFADFRTLKTGLQGEFHTEYRLNIETVKELSVEVTVSMKGFLKAHQIVDFGNTDKFWVIPVTLRNENQGFDLLSEADLISHLAAKLKELSSSEGLSAKSVTDYKRGVQEFLDQERPDRALQLFTEVVHRDATCVACRTMLALAELAYSDWDGTNRDLMQAVEDGRKDPKLGRPEAALALGVMEGWRHEPERSVGFLAEALRYDPKNSLALQEIGRMEILLRNWTKANAYLENAIADGGLPEARLLHVEALLNMGQLEAADEEMTRYLDGRDVKKMPLRVREIWIQLQNRKKVEETYAKVKTKVNEPLDYLRGAMPELKELAPDEDQKLLEPILKAVGQNVWEFHRNFPNTSSLEQIHQQKLNGNGRIVESQDQKFHYLCLAPSQDSEPAFTEYRANLNGEARQPGGFMLTSGFTSISLIFHPAYQSETVFRFLGRQKVNGRDTYVLAFAQHPTRAHFYGSFKAGDIETTTFSQGLAWIDSQNYQIIRLRTDLLQPLPEVQLTKKTAELNFNEVHFKGLTQGFWLPREVAVTVEWRGRVLRNHHEYSDFKLFNVESKDKVVMPEKIAQTPNQGLDPQPPQ